MHAPRSVVILLRTSLVITFAALISLMSMQTLEARSRSPRNLGRFPAPSGLSVSPHNILTTTRTMTRSSMVSPTWIPPTFNTINGRPLGAVLVLPPDVVEHVREIYRLGQLLGRNPRAFAKIGDSTIEYPYFLIPFDNKKYKLGIYGDLQQTIDYYAGSFGRRSAALKVGQHAWTAMNPRYVDLTKCQKGESPTSCELRLWNPSLAIIRLGPNDAGNVKFFEQNFRPLIEYLINRGVVPILSTKADRQPGMIAINNLMRRWAAEYKIPLWDFDLLQQSLPNRGLWTDGVHLSAFAPMDFGDPLAYQRGHAMQNLTALMMLDRLRKIVAP